MINTCDTYGEPDNKMFNYPMKKTDILKNAKVGDVFEILWGIHGGRTIPEGLNHVVTKVTDRQVHFSHLKFWKKSGLPGEKWRMKPNDAEFINRKIGIKNETKN